MRPQHLVLAVPVIALVATVWLPFVNTATLWLGLPSVMVWSAGWVLAITPALALLEFSSRQREADREDLARRRADQDGASR
jgi:hypothetical protein